jgi:hypothetical protein
MLLRSVAVCGNRFKAAAISSRYGDRYSGAHAPDSHTPRNQGIPSRTQTSDLIH